MKELLIFRGGNLGTVTASSGTELGDKGISMNPNALPISWGPTARRDYVEALGRFYKKTYVYVRTQEIPNTWLENRIKNIQQRAKAKIK